MKREVFDRSATNVALAQTRESYVGSELLPDSGNYARQQEESTQQLGRVAIRSDGDSPEPDPKAWKLRARCRGVNPAEFFPIDSLGVEAAQKVCQDCEVRVECLEFALEKPQEFGVWGGASERERRRILKQRQKGAHIRK